MIDHVKKFTGTTNFSNALKVTTASVLPALLFAYFGNFPMGLTVAIGAFLTYPSDIASNLQHKVNGVLTAAVMVSGANLLVNLLHPYPIIFYPFLACLLFFLSMISVYGQRASMVSFSALLSVSLAFAHINTGLQILEHSALMLLGGLFYLLVSLVFHYIMPHRYLELQISECMRLTSIYLKLRGDLWDVDADRQKIIERQLHLQVELNQIHENLREIIFRGHTAAGSSNQNRKMLIVFVSLVEILELALSTSFNHATLHEKFNQHPKVLETYQNLAYSLATTIKRLSKSIQEKTNYVINSALYENLEKLEKSTTAYETDLGKDATSQGSLILNNMQHYAEQQIEKIRVVERAFTLSFNPQDLKDREKDLEKFLSPQYYPFLTFKENLSFSSTVFRHSLRLTVTILIGFIVGTQLPFHNVYWILLTIIVIMRPGYGLTKQRSFERVFGTILGGLIAFAILSLIHNTVVISILAILSMLMGFSFTQINYKVGATFVTLYVVFLYEMLTPNIADIIQYRILDTVVGAALAFGANYLLWPTWEFLNIKIFMEASIRANRNYLKEISVFYIKKGDATTPYKLARKQAFIEIGNLMTSFQRMLQEPKSKQKQLKLVYKLVELNHTLLSSSASLGTYVQTHQTTKASDAFNVVINAIIKNLDAAIDILNLKDEILATKNSKDDIDFRFKQLKDIRAKELKESGIGDEADFRSKMQESQLIIEQLVWLTNLSDTILKSSATLTKA